MSQETLSSTKYTCDRCGDQGTFTDSRQYACWGQVQVQYKDGSTLIPVGYTADLCVNCAQSLQDWFLNPAKPCCLGLAPLSECHCLGGGI